MDNVWDLGPMNTAWNLRDDIGGRLLNNNIVQFISSPCTPSCISVEIITESILTSQFISERKKAIGEFTVSLLLSISL